MLELDGFHPDYPELSHYQFNDVPIFVNLEIVNNETGQILHFLINVVDGEVTLSRKSLSL